MNISSNELDYSKLEYGNYFLDYEENYYMGENVKYATAEFNKLYIRRIRLPHGKGNIIYVLTDSFENCIKMINSKNFIVPPNYRRLYYPWLLFGQFLRRRYRYTVVKEKANRTSIIKTKTKLMPLMLKKLPNTRENLFFCTSDIYNAVNPLMALMPPKRIYDNFFKEFIGILENNTPPLSEKDELDNNPNSNNRILLIDADSFGFKMGAPLEENKTNPLFIIYLAFIRNRGLASIDVDKEMLITSKNMFMKFNPIKTTMAMWPKFKMALFRIMNANLDDYTDQLSDDEKKEIEPTAEDHLTRSIVTKTLEPFSNNISPSTKGVLIDAVDSSIKTNIRGNLAIDRLIRDETNNVAKNINPNSPSLFQKVLKDNETKSLIKSNPTLSEKRRKLFAAIDKDYVPLITKTEDDELTDEDIDLIDEYEDDIKDDINDILNNDENVIEEVLDEIQDKIAPLSNENTSPINSARDKKLREAQKKIVIKDSTIGDILERDSSNIPIKSENKSNVMKTSNNNMKNIKFANFEKTYIEELYHKDLIAAFDMLKDKNSPFYITGVDIKDSSTIEDLKETWSVHLTDENKKRHTIKVDIPKFYDNRFMIIGGNKYMILKQNFYNPLVKDTPNTVIMTTNYNKITIQRKATKSLLFVEKIFSLIRKSGDNKIFIPGNSSRENLKYISSLEYDELAKRLFKYKSEDCEIYFSREYIKKELSDRIPGDIKGNEFYIGTEKNIPILINEDTGKDRSGRTISQIIEDNLDDNNKLIFKTIKIPKQSMFAESKLAGQFIPVVAVLIVWIGLSKTLDKMKVKWEFYPDLKKVPKNNNRNYIKFLDGTLGYESSTFAELILNGLSKLIPENFNFKDFNTDKGYNDFIFSVWGNYNGITEIKNFYDFLIDPITKDVCRDLLLPQTPDELLIHAVKLLSDNACVSKASDKSYRVRSVEMIPAILYSCIAAQYKNYIKSGGRIPMTIPQRAVITKLQAEKTVEEYSTLNPAIEVSKTHTISAKGYKGSNSEHSYDEEKRSYDPSNVGKISITSSPDANIGINRNLVIEPTLTNARGYREEIEDSEELRDVNLLSPGELLTPGTIRTDDPMRSSIAVKQTQHLVPVESSDLTLVSNGFDEAIRFHLSSDFVINAEEDGEVIDVDEDTGFIMVKYTSGKTRAINTNPEVVKNSGGGFYTSNKLKPVLTKVGQKFKKDEVLAYHDKYFKYSKLNGLRYILGPLVKIAVASSYNTYEDAGICTYSLAEKMKTKIVYQESATFKRNSNIFHMVKIGDHVNIGDALIKYDISFDDNEISKYLSKLSEENKEVFESDIKNEIKTNHAGEIVDIKVYTLQDPSNLSESLGNVVKTYFDKINNKKKFLEKYDSTPGIIKAGHIIRDSTVPLKTRYNTIKGYKGIDVLIEFYIEHDDVLGTGDKWALYAANKQIISEMIPKGYEPYSEFRPDEEISALCSPGTLARRMTSSHIAVSAAMKCMIELKRKIKKDIKYK